MAQHGERDVWEAFLDNMDAVIQQIQGKLFI